MRRLERFLGKMREAMSVQTYYDAWQQHGEEHATDEYRAEMEADFAKYNAIYDEAKQGIEALVALLRAEAPQEIHAWVDAHDAYLARRIEAKPDDDDVYFMNKERGEWAKVRNGSLTYVTERIWYPPETNEYYRQLFGIDLKTLEDC